MQYAMKETIKCRNASTLVETRVEVPNKPARWHPPHFPATCIRSITSSTGGPSPDFGVSHAYISTGMQRVRTLLLLLIAVLPLGGCLLRSRPVALRTSTAQLQTLQTATGNDLVERINAESTQIQTLKATVGITASVGGSKRGKITEYQEIHG